MQSLDTVVIKHESGAAAVCGLPRLVRATATLRRYSVTARMLLAAAAKYFRSSSTPRKRRPL